VQNSQKSVTKVSILRVRLRPIATEIKGTIFSHIKELKSVKKLATKIFMFFGAKYFHI